MVCGKYLNRVAEVTYRGAAPGDEVSVGEQCVAKPESNKSLCHVFRKVLWVGGSFGVRIYCFVVVGVGIPLFFLFSTSKAMDVIFDVLFIGNIVGYQWFLNRRLGCRIRVFVAFYSYMSWNP